MMTITTTVWFRSDGTYLVLRDEVDISASVAGLILQLSTDGPASHGQISGTFVGTAELPADLAHIPPGVPWPGTAAESNAAIREHMDWGDAYRKYNAKRDGPR